MPERTPPFAPVLIGIAVPLPYPRIAGAAEQREVAVTIGEPGGLFVLDRATGELLWQTIMGSQITGFPITHMAGGRQYLTVPVGGSSIFQLTSYAAEMEAPMGSNLLVTFAVPASEGER